MVTITTVAERPGLAQIKELLRLDRLERSIREAHFVSMNSNSGATDSGIRAVRGRNVVVLRRWQRQWKRRARASLKVPNKVRNEWV
jgi:hypothetical protein